MKAAKTDYPFVTKTHYEWDIEILDIYGDIIDHDFQSRFPGSGGFNDAREVFEVVVLVKTYACGLSGFEDSFVVKDRTWAYLLDGKLPEEFDDGTRVPKRFHEEVKRFYSKI